MNLKLKAKIVENFGSQADFASLLGVDEAKVSRIIRGRRDLSEKEKRTWARKLHCRPEDIFIAWGGTDNECAGK